MDKGIGSRNGKVVAAGHTTRIEGLNKLIKELEEWPEITQIRIGHIKVVKANTKGGFSFRATRLAMAGNRTTGIQCVAKYGTQVQQVILCGNDLNALKARLSTARYGGTW